MSRVAKLCMEACSNMNALRSFSFLFLSTTMSAIVVWSSQRLTKPTLILDIPGSVPHTMPLLNSINSSTQIPLLVQQQRELLDVRLICLVAHQKH